MTASYTNDAARMPTSAWVLSMVSLKIDASTSRAATMIASPVTPMMSVATGPTLMATRSWNRAESRTVVLCRARAKGSSLTSRSMIFAVGTSGGITVRMPSPRSSDQTPLTPRSIARVISNSASRMMRRSSSFRAGEPNPTTSVSRTVQLWPLSGHGCTCRTARASSARAVADPCAPLAAPKVPDELRSPCWVRSSASLS
jgi:hypothetical protein